MKINRREFIKTTCLTLPALSIIPISAADTPPPLAAKVAAVCHRLARYGWRELFLALTHGRLDFSSTSLAQDLTGLRLDEIDRRMAGFEDFAAEGHYAIEPGSPARSLLFHALACPSVVAGVQGKALTGFPTPEEIETVENYVYGARPPSLDELRERAGGSPLRMVVFSSEYRTARHSGHHRHADLVFSRTATARVGTAKANYDPRRRDFVGLDPNDPFAFRVLPTRFAAYIATQQPGDAASERPVRFQAGDEARRFWIPLHKLFPGRECLRGLDLKLHWQGHFQNEKLRCLHQFFEETSLPGFKEPERSGPPFVLSGDTLARVVTQGAGSSALVMPTPHPLFEKAVFKGRALDFEVSTNLTGAADRTWFSTAQFLDGAGYGVSDDHIAYMDGLNPRIGRAISEYLNVRHRSTKSGRDEDLNQIYKNGTLRAIIKHGGYRARHYVDYSGDGWVSVSCPALDSDSLSGQPVPAYVGVAPPDFFPAINQAELMDWWKNKVPASIRPGLWCIEPWTLADDRVAANVTLPAGFEISDDTVTALVSHPAAGPATQRPFQSGDKSFMPRLPDASNGVFDPGWDFSQDIQKTEAGPKRFLANHGLGSPFVEDIKLCAALGSFWPAVAPDATRSFIPAKMGQDFVWPWPSIAPLTDEEVGVPVNGSVVLSWDGVRGAEIVQRQGKPYVSYPDIDLIDYITLHGKLTAHLTAQIDLDEYTSRILTMAAIYWSLNIRYEDYLKANGQKALAVNRMQKAKSEWAVASFRKVRGVEEDYRVATEKTGARLKGERLYRVIIYRYGEQSRDPADRSRVLVEMRETLSFYVNPELGLFRFQNGQWKHEALFSTP